MIALDRDIVSLGRRQADILLDDPRASGAHAEIRREGSGHKLVDLGSTNGTLLNQKSVKEARLSDQDVIEIGSTTICYFSDIRDFHGEVEEATQTQKRKEPLPPEEPSIHAEQSRVTDWSTTSQKIPMHTVELEVLQGESKGMKSSFQKSQITIGRTGSDVVLRDNDLSRSHCMIEILSRSSVFLKDLGSTNGTFLNGEKIGVSRIRSSDLIGVGSTILKFELKNSQEEEIRD